MDFFNTLGWAALLPGRAELAVFAVAVLLLNATPGVDFLLTVTRTAQGGVKSGVATAGGITAGCVVHALAAASGLAALLAVHPLAFQILQWAGAAYLAALGWKMLREAFWPVANRAPSIRAAQASPSEATASRGTGADFRAGLFTNVLNPKVALFFLAFLPQFVPVDSPNPTASFLLLGAWFIAQGGLFTLTLVGVVAGLAASARLSGRAVPAAVNRAFQAVCGLAFVALALRLLRERSTGVA